MNYYLFSFIEYGNEKAKQVLTQALDLHRTTNDAWQRLWELSVNSGQPLWQALCLLGALIAAISLIYLMVKESSEHSLDLTRVITMCKFPLGIAVLLGGNGRMLAGLIIYLHQLSLVWLEKILAMTFAGISISDAIRRVQNTAIANDRAREIFSECIEKTGDILAQCIQDPVKLEQVRELVNTTDALDRNLLEQIGGNITNAVVALVTTPALNALGIYLHVLQWAFVNVIEAALLLTALFAPVALGLSIVPSLGPTIFKWLSGYISLLLMPLGYVILVGFIAIVLNLASQADQSMLNKFQDVGFSLFMSVFAPVLSIAISKGIGDGVYEGISRSIKLTAEAGMAAATQGSSLLASRAINS